MQIEKPIVVTEFPKSGGSWIISMLGDALRIPKRDIYVRRGFNLFELSKHPWYRDGADLDFLARSVIKSHELPDSPLIDFDATYLHIVRDGRDVVVSKWFFERDFCVQNGITTSFTGEFDEYVERTARDWSNYVNAWAQKSVPTIHYEIFLADTAEALESTLKKISDHRFRKDEIEAIVSKFTKEKFAASLDEVFRHNTFVRKGIRGDWKNHFSEKNVATFKSVAGDALLSLGYESSSTWHL